MEDNDTTSIEHYEITETIHESAEGVIYRAIEKPSNHKVLIKKYYPGLNWSDQILNEFYNLASYLRFIEHEYILSVVDIGKHDGRPYVVFEDHVAALLSDRQAGKPDLEDSLNFLSKVAEALDFIHKQEILHGVLNPANIALDIHGYPLLFDFGFGGVFRKLLLENMDAGFENLAFSDLRCTSPEQIMGHNPTRASDIYMFGIVAFYYIFGKYPFDSQYMPETALLHFSRDLVPIEKPETISLNTLQFIQKCVQTTPEKRFANFPQILISLDRMMNGKKSRVRFDPRFKIKTNPVSRRIPVSFKQALAGLAVLGLGLYTAYSLFGSKPQVPPPAATPTNTAPATAEPIQTQKIDVVTPTKFYTVTPAATAETKYQLAFEGEKPYIPPEAISISNIANLQEISRLGYGKPEEADIAPDNTHTALATSAGVLILEGNQLLKWIDPQGWATSVQFSPDGSVLAIGLMNGEIQLWDWNNGVRFTPLTGEWHHKGKINRILFSSQGSYLYSASADQHIIVWDWKSGKSIRDIPAHASPVNDIAVTSDGRTLVSCADDRLIRVWDVNAESNNKLYELGPGYFSGTIKALAISSDDTYLAAGSDSGYLYQWRFVTTPLLPGDGLKYRADAAPVSKRIWSLAYIRNDQELVLGVDDGETITYDATRVRYGGTSVIEPRAKLNYDAFGNDFDFGSFSILQGDIAVSINWDGKITFQQNQIAGPMLDNFDRLDFSSNGSVLAAGGKYGSTRVWNLSTNETLFQNYYSMPFGNPLAPDGSTIAIIVPSNDPRLSDIYQLKKLTGAQTTVDLSSVLPNSHVGYSKDGSIFIAANLTTSKAWDFASGKKVDVQAQDHFGCRIIVPNENVSERLLVNSAIDTFLPSDNAHIDSLCPKVFQVKNNVSAFSQNLNLFAFINSNGWLESYDILGGKSAWQPYDLTSSEAVKSMAISPDATIIAVGDKSGKVILFSGHTGQPIGELVGNFGSVQAIEFSEDGKMIATAGSDGVVHVFGIVRSR